MASILDRPEEEELTQEDRNILLVEYQKAQDSAEHFDTVSWAIKSVLWAGNLVLLGFALDQLVKICTTTEHAVQSALVTTVSLIGIMAAIAAYLWSRQCSRAIGYKYCLCKRIESRIGMEHHQKTPWKRGLGSLLTTGATWVLVLTWAATIILSWALASS